MSNGLRDEKLHYTPGAVLQDHPKYKNLFSNHDNYNFRASFTEIAITIQYFPPENNISEAGRLVKLLEKSNPNNISLLTSINSTIIFNEKKKNQSK